MKVFNCQDVFHYGVFDLPLPCRFRMNAVANLETEVYGQLEFMNMSGETIAGGDDGDPSPSDVAFSNLYPAVIECFFIILCGYMAGRLNLISQTESKGLNTFVGTFSLPALIFKSMATLDFSMVNWLFLLSICISKATVFFMVALITLLVYKPVDFSKAGLFGIFCTQSNDFALGYPIIKALYDVSHPEFASYLYLVAPISLVLLNPIGFVFMEIGKRMSACGEDGNENTHIKENKWRMAVNIMKDILLNPIVLMTTLGILGNFAFDKELPVILDGVLTVLGKAFSASALFMLGLRMVGKVQTLRGSGFVVPGILIAVKTLILPLVTREIVSLLKPGINANETSDYSNFGFLYSTFPTAPGVFVYSTQYNVAVDLVASAMVACTFLSAPLMFVSAKMVTLVHINPVDYVKELEAILFNVSIIGVVCTMWVLIIFLLSRKWKKVPHFVTMCLAVSQLVACIGALMWSVVDCNHTWKLYVQFILFSWGVFSSRLWTAILAVTLFLLRWRSLCFVLRLRPILALIGWGLPAIIVAFLVLGVKLETDIDGSTKHDPNFQYGWTQAVVALLLLWFSLFTTMVALILQQRHQRRYLQYESLLNLDDSPPNSQRSSTTEPPNRCLLLSQRSIDVDDASSVGGISCSVDVQETESLFSPHEELCGSSNGVGGSRFFTTLNTQLHRQASLNQLTDPEENGIVRDRDDEFQMMRHIVLLLFLCASMIVGFALCMWTLVTEDVNGVYVELVFLDIVLNFGQGFFTAAIFGLDTKLIVVPLIRRWRHFWYGASEIQLPPWDDLDSFTKQTCDQFSNYHMDKCIKDIVRDRKWRLKTLSSVFSGNDLIDWLLMVGLAYDRQDATKYGRRLLQGGIISHIDRLHHFHDQPLFYTFKNNQNTA
ncbi:unnamed protein product, partial [Meganyctiphanes norvegica]